MEDLDAQLNRAQSKVVELFDLNQMLEKHQAIYIAKKRSPVDQALSVFINSYPERDNMNILFLRESEGVYQFGSRRVYVKIEKGDKLMVRVGGGYMHIKDFIEQFTPQEREKCRKRKNVFQRFQQKLNAQKISTNLSERSRELSPIKMTQNFATLSARGDRSNSSVERPRSLNKSSFLY